MEANREFDVTCNGKVLENTAHSKYLYVTMDRTDNLLRILGDKCKYNQNHGLSALLLCGGICLSSMGNVTARVTHVP